MGSLGLSEARPIGKTALDAWRAELRATLALGLPLIASQLAQIAINTTDTLMMGRLGAQALAAGALGTTLQFLFVIAGIGLTIAAGAMVAQERGARSSAVRGPRRTVRQGLWAVTILSVPSLIVLWNAESVLMALGQDPELSRQAVTYIRASMWALPFVLWFTTLRAFASALERPWPVLVITLVAIAANAAMNYVLMFGKLGFPALGIQGTGIATTVVNAAMLVALAIFIHRDRRMHRYRLAGRLWRTDWPRLWQLTKVGLPISLLLLAEVGAFAATTALAGMLGTVTLAAHTIALQIASVAFMVPLGLSQATTVRVGLAHGARRDIAVPGHVSLSLALGFALLTAALFFALPSQFVAAFINRAEAPEVTALAIGFLFLAAVFQLVDAAQIVLGAALRGLGDTALPLGAGVVGYWLIGLPLGAALAFGWLGEPWGGRGVWVGLATGLTVVAILFTLRWAKAVLRPGSVGLPPPPRAETPTSAPVQQRRVDLAEA